MPTPARTSASTPGQSFDDGSVRSWLPPKTRTIESTISWDSDDYMQYHGGMIATVRALTGSNPQQFFGDSSDPTRARVRKLEDEARRVFRTRVVNPQMDRFHETPRLQGCF
ncbi:MAG: hypothetical protein Ct9H300mP11_19470 [Chloroflexota bacterium]|nr:MAG: hypothetical protein Ct9H300mP11_19470 [Chloroflexota bacterium]